MPIIVAPERQHLGALDDVPEVVGGRGGRLVGFLFPGQVQENVGVVREVVPVRA